MFQFMRSNQSQGLANFQHHQTSFMAEVFLPFDPTSHVVLPHPADYVHVENVNGAGSHLSLRDDISHSGQTIVTMINICSEPDFFSAVGALGPAPAHGGVDNALLVRSEREFIEVAWHLLGMTPLSLIYDINHRQWNELHADGREAHGLRRSIVRSQLLVADTIAEHINTVLGVDDLSCYKYGWSCGNDANFDQGHEGLLGKGTLRVIDQIDAIPLSNLKYTSYRAGQVEDQISDHVFSKINELIKLPEFDHVDAAAEEFIVQRAREVARVRGVGAALASEHLLNMTAAEVERRRRDGSTAAQHDHAANVWAPAGREAELKRRAADGPTAAQHDHNVAAGKTANAGSVEAQAARAAASGDQICCRAGCRRKAQINYRTGIALIHGRCQTCK